MAIFSVILPTYNRRHVLQRAIKSVLDQKFEDWELVVVDDGSTDDTETMMKEFLTDQRVKYIQKENTGASHSRNVGAAEAKGKYFAFLDSDDTFEPDKLEVTYMYIQKYSGGNCFYSGFRRIDSVSGKVLSEVEGTVPNDMKEQLKNRNPIRALGTVVIPREIFFKVGGFDPDFKARQDVDLYYRVSKVAEFIAIPDVLTNIYINATDRITANYFNRLSGFQSYLKKHGSEMTFPQKSYLAKRIFVYALLNKSYSVALRSFPMSLWSIGAKIFKSRSRLN